MAVCRFKTIALIGRYNSPDVAERLARMGDYWQAGREGWSRRTRLPTRQRLHSDYDEIGARADLVVVQGGDEAAQRSTKPGDPMLPLSRQPGPSRIHDRHRFVQHADAMAELPRGRHTSKSAPCSRECIATACHAATLALNDAVVNKSSVG